MKIISKEFEYGSYIPQKFTCNDENINPELEFVDVPEEAKSLVLIFDDPDVPEVLREDRIFDHWLLFNIPVDTKKIEENSIVGVSGINTRGGLNYIGPCPPDTIHRYFFRLYALNKELELDEGATKEKIYNAMEENIIAKAVLVGLYEQSNELKSIEVR